MGLKERQRDFTHPLPPLLLQSLLQPHPFLQDMSNSGHEQEPPEMGHKSPAASKQLPFFLVTENYYIIFKYVYLVQDYQKILKCKEPYGLNLLFFLQVHVNIYLGDRILPDEI